MLYVLLFGGTCTHSWKSGYLGLGELTLGPSLRSFLLLTGIYRTFDLWICNKFMLRGE
ncbi:uncharacterized protein EI90DRAFT_3061383 [Cantharellus anzutake]|uniref:uncharacterized protein n=1 Tax=Cantharellus anzutake TaxID=1750568 RepID=UPI0019034CC7|nr:uncharacterized protein EI90DRAFT_3076674 [Cantharellus anzutake]XP_038915274.1 uncharacterized protein EI90DRAFT_3061383 [Cantharellus anzutake]KAF8323644.1 hypothetical protein EI90DRAFT_3076674 [Cantharellus anzutake]KAF8330053.1 hypothetical protein EI90DRAFT_3061383 [Cantharellus anzutake]